MVTRLSRAPLEGRGREQRWHCGVAWCVEEVHGCVELHGVWSCMVCEEGAWCVEEVHGCVELHGVWSCMVCEEGAWCVEELHGCGWREDRIKHESYIGIESQ